MVKVAILLISPGKAGVESVVLNIIKNLNRDSVQLYLISSAEIAPYYEGLLDQEQQMVLGKFFSKSKNKYSRWIQGYIQRKLNLNERKLERWSKKVLAFLDKNEIKIMHSHLVWDYWMASKIREKRPDITYINTMHGTLALDPSDDYFPFFERSTILKILSNADIFTSACRYFIDLLKIWNVPVKETAIIPNGIDKAVSDPAYRSSASGVVKICFMGGGRPHQKGGDILIHALKILVTEYKITDIRLTIFGDVPAQSKERELAERMGVNDKIEWAGFVEPPHHLKGIHESDIFVLPSRHEGVANTLMEAIGMCMPIVATRAGGTSEIIKDGNNGLLCFTDATDLAEKLSTLIKDKALRDQFSRANKILRESYYWETVCTQYEKLYLGIGVN